MILDSALAQHIVDRAMAILPQNINVMDAQGMIIGSGDPERMHTRHEGAQLVLANRRVVEIDQQAAACLRGVRPGVNLPLMYAQQLIGVLGITGSPEIVRPYAQLVRMAAEMLVEQRQLQAERNWQRHQLESWLCLLLEPQQSLDNLEAEALRLDVQLHWPMQACLLELDDTRDSALRQARVLGALNSKSDYLCTLSSARELFYCRPACAGRGDSAWLAAADERDWGVRRLLVSDAAHSLEELRQASLALRDLQVYARACNPQERLLHLDQHRGW